MAGVEYDLLTNDERKNLTQVALLVLDLTPKAMRRLATSVKDSWTPAAIGSNYKRCKDKIDKEIQLSYDKKNMFSNPGDGFNNCDTSCLYKIIRRYDLVPCPTKKWAVEPSNLHNYGDFVEKLRAIRNLVVHSPHVRFSKEKMQMIKENICVIIEAMCILKPNINKDLKLHIERYLPEIY